MGTQESTNYQNYAYRVLSIIPGGPAYEAGLEEYLDYILYNPQANDNTLFSEYLLKNLGKEIKL